MRYGLRRLFAVVNIAAVFCFLLRRPLEFLLTSDLGGLYLASFLQGFRPLLWLVGFDGPECPDFQKLHGPIQGPVPLAMFVGFAVSIPMYFLLLSTLRYFLRAMWAYGNENETRSLPEIYGAKRAEVKAARRRRMAAVVAVARWIYPVQLINRTHDRLRAQPAEG